MKLKKKKHFLNSSLYETLERELAYVLPPSKNRNSKFIRLGDKLRDKCTLVNIWLNKTSQAHSFTVKNKERTSVYIYITGRDNYEVLAVAPTVWMRVTLLFWENCGAQPSSVLCIRALISMNHISFLCSSLMGL